jgi:hypothetical protein
MLLQRTSFNLVFIALMASLGLAIKPIIGPIAKLIASSLFLPGGVIAGAVYLIWPMLALLVVKHKGSAVLVGFLQGAITFITGLYGSHGIFSFATYTLPCLCLEIIYYAMKKLNEKFATCISTATANVCGTVLISLIYLHLTRKVLLLASIPAGIFGACAGLLAMFIVRKFERLL